MELRINTINKFYFPILEISFSACAFFAHRDEDCAAQKRSFNGIEAQFGMACAHCDMYSVST